MCVVIGYGIYVKENGIGADVAFGLMRDLRLLKPPLRADFISAQFIADKLGSFSTHR